MDEKVPPDPLMILNKIEACLGPLGEIKDEGGIQSLHNLMKESLDKLVSKCIVMNILAATSNENILNKFVDGEGWNLLNTWLKDSRDKSNIPLLLELLKIYIKLPVSIPLLKTNDTAKVIKQLTKIDWGESAREEIQSLAKQIVTNWMNMIHETKSKNAQLSAKSKTPASIQMNNKTPKPSPDNEDSQTSSSNSADVSDNTNVSQASLASTSNHIANSHSFKPGHKVRLKKTAKTFQAKFRATGLEEEMKPPPSIKSINKITIKRITDDPNSLAKKIKHIDNNKSINPPPSTEEMSSSTPDLKSPQTPHHIVESTGFMDALDVAAHETSTVKRRLSTSIKLPNKPCAIPLNPTKTSITINSSKEIKSKSTLPTSTPAEPLKNTPVVLSFYKDSHEADENRENQENVSETHIDIKEEGDVMVQADDISEKMEIVDLKDENECGSAFDPNISDVKMEADEGPRSILSSAGKTTAKANKKIVKWKEDAHITEIYYFELDESERAFVRSEHPQFADMKRNELALEKRALQHAKKVTDLFPWKVPPLIDGLVPLLSHPGINSREKHVQSLRESRALQEIYFDVRSIPDAPKEADHDNSFIGGHGEHLGHMLGTGVSSTSLGGSGGDIVEMVDKGDQGTPLLSAPIVIPLEDVNNPDNVIDYRNYQIPLNDENSKKPNKKVTHSSHKLKHLTPPPSHQPPLPISNAEGLPPSSSTPLGMVAPNGNPSAFVNFPGQQMMVPPPPPGTIMPRPPFMGGQNANIPYPGLPPMPPPINHHPMIVNNGMAPPPPGGMMMMNMSHYPNPNNHRMPPMYVPQQNQMGMMNQMQSMQQQFRMRYQPPLPMSNSHGLNNDHGRDKSFGDDRSKQNQQPNPPSHPQRPMNRPQRPPLNPHTAFKKQVCKHFNAPTGCRFGKNCSFLHVKDNDRQTEHSTTHTATTQKT